MAVTENWEINTVSKIVREFAYLWIIQLLVSARKLKYGLIAKFLVREEVNNIQKHTV